MNSTPTTAQMPVYSTTADDVSSFSDLDQLTPGEWFEVTWSFTNRTTAAWDDRFQLIYSEETHPDTAAYQQTRLGADPALPLAKLGVVGELIPGDTAYLTAAFAAPNEPGSYVTAWQLQTPSGEAVSPVRWLRVVVVEPPEKGLGELSYELVHFQNSAAEYNKMTGGQTFSGTWTLRNTSIDPWPGDFRVVYVEGGRSETHDALRHRMGTAASYTLRELTGRDRIESGETFTLRLNFVAPQQPNIYAFHWQMVSSNGQPFGGTRWMRIIVTQPNGTSPPPPVATRPYTYSGPQARFFTGIHGPADDFIWHQPHFQEMVRRLNMPVFFMSHGSNPDFAHFGDPQRNVVRLYWNPEPVSADRAYEYVRDDQMHRWWERGYRRFVFFNEPQLTTKETRSAEGFGIAWHSAEQFAHFLARCLSRARQDFPGIHLYTTPMTSNEAFHPWQWRAAMWEQVKGLVNGWCMHAYTGDNQNAHAAAQDIANQIVALQRRFQLQIPIIVSEASVNRGNNAAQKAQVARLLPQKLAQVPGIEGVFWYAADWNPDYDTHHEGWLRNGIADAYLRQVA